MERVRTDRRSTRAYVCTILPRSYIVGSGPHEPHPRSLQRLYVEAIVRRGFTGWKVIDLTRSALSGHAVAIDGGRIGKRNLHTTERTQKDKEIAGKLAGKIPDQPWRPSFVDRSLGKP